MKKIKLNQDNKILLILLGILLVCFISIGLLFYKYFYAGTSKTKYGNRLDGIENYSLSETLNKDIESIFSDTKEFNSVVVNNEGKIIYITIDFKEAIKVESAKSLAIKTLDKIGTENLSYYDIQFLITYSGEEENSNYPIFGSKSSNSTKVVW